MISLSSRERNIFVACVAVVLVFIGYSLVYEPLSVKNSDLSGQLKAMQAELTASMRIIKKAKRYQARHESYMTKFRQKVSDDEVMTSMLTLIDQEAAKLDVRILELKPRQVRKEELVNNFSVSVSLEGPMTEVVKMLYALESAPHFFNVEEARFDQHYQKASSLQCQLILSKIFFP